MLSTASLHTNTEYKDASVPRRVHVSRTVASWIALGHIQRTIHRDSAPVNHSINQPVKHGAFTQSITPS